ncbi:MAG: ubiquinol-cytochrome c reductase iron-sulfur subunit [Nitrospirae bacterium]|nr:ubiquinol-cytochrome c reductase iron-sulfur subunit [Nitrospirota bacterium]
MSDTVPAHGNRDETGREREDDSVTRRKFFKVVIGVTAFLNGLILGIPFLRAIINPAPLQKLSYTEVGDIGSLPIGEPQDMNFAMRSGDAYRHEEVIHSVWVVKHSPAEVTVFSPICTHLGCHYKWNPQAGHFECPCHGSVFTITGKVIGGPAPRPLDTLPHKLEKGKLFVEWERFKVGVSEKVRA